MSGTMESNVVSVHCYCSECLRDQPSTAKSCIHCGSEIIRQDESNSASCLLASAQLAQENPDMRHLGSGYDKL